MRRVGIRPCIEKRPDGSLIAGGRWLGGRAYMVCASQQFELAMRPQNLPAIQQLFAPWSYFIDTTYAVPPRECADPNHPLSRNDDIAWKSKLSDKARELFGLFGSECGREWALPHSDFFEGLVGVSGHYFHNLKPESLGAHVIPFWEMVYHDCQICYGKYEYAADQAGEYVAHHVLTARPLHYHTLPDHRYWLDNPDVAASKPTADLACFTRTDNGWAAGLHPTDAFLKTTHEVLGPLHQATAHQRLVRFEYLAPDRSLRRAVYGDGLDATTVVVNFGAAEASVQSALWGDVLLPPWGFVVDGPRFTACYAKRAAGREYPDGTLFTLQAIEGPSLVAGDKAAGVPRLRRPATHVAGQNLSDSERGGAHALRRRRRSCCEDPPGALALAMFIKGLRTGRGWIVTETRAARRDLARALRLPPGPRSG